MKKVDSPLSQVAHLQKQLENCHNFYAVRWQRLIPLLKEKGIWTEACNIMANGTISPEENPTYSQIIEKYKDQLSLLQKELKLLKSKS